jgi:hypothetical protein
VAVYNKLKIRLLCKRVLYFAQKSMYVFEENGLENNRVLDSGGGERLGIEGDNPLVLELAYPAKNAVASNPYFSQRNKFPSPPSPPWLFPITLPCSSCWLLAFGYSLGSTS